MTCERCEIGEATFRVKSDLIDKRVCTPCGLMALWFDLFPLAPGAMTVTRLEKGASNANQLY